jgi:HSP20 family protein
LDRKTINNDGLGNNPWRDKPQQSEIGGKTMTMLPTKKFSPMLRPRSIFEPWFQQFFDDNEDSFFSKLIPWDERMGSMDFEKTEKDYTISVDVPGLTKDDVHVDVEEGVMTISAERKPKEKKDGIEYIVSERSYRRFSRTFRLPEDVDLEKVDTKMENGVLTLTIGRKINKKSAKKIEIK